VLHPPTLPQTALEMTRHFHVRFEILGPGRQSALHKAVKCSVPAAILSCTASVTATDLYSEKQMEQDHFQCALHEDSLTHERDSDPVRTI
jgi:hypothetical protein